MSQDILATEVSLARDEILMQEQLTQLIATGRKRKIRKALEQVSQAPEPVAPPVAAPPEQPKDSWERFSPSMRRLVEYFEKAPESHILTREVRELIELVSTGETVADFDRFNDTQLAGFLETIRRHLPRIQNEITMFIESVNSVRALPVDVEFI